MALAQGNFLPDRQLEQVRRRFSRVQRTGKVARVDGDEFLARQRIGGGARLGVAHRRERHVELALDAALGVPGGLAVADETEAGGVHEISVG